MMMLKNSDSKGCRIEQSAQTKKEKKKKTKGKGKESVRE
jgi:hypothetical protein